MKTYFFTSYARGEDRAWVRRFHADLEREMRVRHGPFSEGHLAAPGREAVRAAAASPAMVALISDRYTRDAECGRDWAIFAERVAPRPEARDMCLIPVRWRPLRGGPVASLPASMRPMPGFWTSAAAEPYAGSGVYELMRTRRLGEAGGYYTIVRSVAAQVFAAEHLRLGALDEGAAARVEPAFGEPDGREEPGRTRAEPVGAGAGAAAPGRAGAPGPPRTVAISYVGADQPWAEYIGNLLRRNDYEVELVRWNAGRSERLGDSVARARDTGERVIAVLSQNFVAPHMKALVREENLDWEQALAPSGAGEAPVIPVQVDTGPLPGRLGRRAIRLHGLGDTVIRDLLDAVRKRGT